MHYMAVGHSPLIMDSWRYLLETFTEYSTMLLVYLAEKLLVQSAWTIQKESYECSKSEKWKGYKSLFVRPGYIFSSKNCFCTGYECSLILDLIISFFQ